MVDWQSIVTRTTEFAELRSLSIIFNGIYLHEFVCFVAYDWKLLTRKGASEHTSLLIKSVKVTYLCCRYLALISAVTELYMYFRLYQGYLPCEVLMTMSTGIGALATTCSSALIAIRALTLWRWNARITALIGIAFLALLGTDIQSTVLVRSTYEPAFSLCSTEHANHSLPNLLSLLICDVVVLTCLLTGLRRWHDPRKKWGAFRLWTILWNQGVIYLVLASATEVPAVVFLLLRLNSVMNSMFTTPLVVILVVATTRFYRSLHSFTPNQTRDDFTNTVRFATVDIGTRGEHDEDGFEMARRR
ncbi:unnamed protein product [Peniophora sp. CBMAI 1063]|nr:unnamed protein product [Peniophora sp. CBMAI 1063]